MGVRAEESAPGGSPTPSATVLHITWTSPHDDGDPGVVAAGRALNVTVLAAGITIIQIADIAGVYMTGVGGYHNGGVVDVARVAGFGMLAFAALFSVGERPVETSATNLQPGVRVWLPYLPLMAAGIAGVSFELIHRDHRPLFVAEGFLWCRPHAPVLRAR